MHTKDSSCLSRPSGQRGSALIIVIILCSVTLILVGSYLASLSSQTRVGYRASLQNEARNASEGVAEYALAEITRRADATASFGASGDVLSGYTIPTSDVNFIAPGTGNNHVVAADIAYKASVLSDAPSAPMYIDPDDDVNRLDNLKAQVLSVRSMNVFARAAVLDPRNNSKIYSYVSENVQVREQSWFNYAIFYNMDIEFHAGPNFTVLGPVHTNASAYITEGDGNYLKFFSTLSAFGSLYRYDKYTGNRSGGHGGTVQAISAAGMLAANLKTMATAEDSTNTNFNTLASTKWNSFVQDHTFNVKKFNPPGLPAYVPENFSTTGTVELRNHAYLMIEPQLSAVTTTAEYTGGVSDYGQKPLDSENLKFSAQSSFVIQVFRPTAIGEQPKWKLLVYQPSDTTHALSANNPPARDTITGKPIVALTIDPFNDPDDDLPSPQGVVQKQLKIDLLDAIISVPYRDGGTSVASWGNGTSTLRYFNQSAPATTATRYYPLYDRREGYIYPGSTSSSPNGLKGAMHVLRIDLGKLNTLLNNSARWKKPYGSTDFLYNPATQYTGVVYVQMPLEAIDTSRFPTPLGSTADGDMIRPAQRATTTSPGYAVLLSNGETVPQLAGGSPDGFTIATNAPVYVWGNFNADGLSGTGSSTAPDSASEVPALIAGDSVFILSANTGFHFDDMNTNTSSAASFTEVSAAIVAGLVPTQPGTDNIWSGGVHNLVRFHENWSSSTYRYRGSIAVLYQSEVAKAPYHEGYAGYYYGAPTRDMGYHQYLSQGRFPPATPIKRTIRRMNLQDITAAQYATGPSKPGRSN